MIASTNHRSVELVDFLLFWCPKSVEEYREQANVNHPNLILFVFGAHSRCNIMFRGCRMDGQIFAVAIFFMQINSVLHAFIFVLVCARKNLGLSFIWNQFCRCCRTRARVCVRVFRRLFILNISL